MMTYEVSLQGQHHYNKKNWSGLLTKWSQITILGWDSSTANKETKYYKSYLIMS